MSLTANSTMNVGSKGHFFLAIQLPLYYYNRNYHSTFIDHEFVEEDFYTSLRIYLCNSNRDETIVLAIHKPLRK